jgi:hypothetical protein
MKRFLGILVASMFLASAGYVTAASKDDTEKVEKGTKTKGAKTKTEGKIKSEDTKASAMGEEKAGDKKAGAMGEERKSK